MTGVSQKYKFINFIIHLTLCNLLISACQPKVEEMQLSQEDIKTVLDFVPVRHPNSYHVLLEEHISEAAVILRIWKNHEMAFTGMEVRDRFIYENDSVYFYHLTEKIDKDKGYGLQHWTPDASFWRFLVRRADEGLYIDRLEFAIWHNPSDSLKHFGDDLDIF